MLRHTPDDGFPTPTSRVQRETEEIISESSSATFTLNRKGYLSFIARALLQGFPKHYAYQDASQAWFMFWSLHGFSLLGAGLDPDNKQRCAVSH
ncbi:hypothetical protein JB92DRAFT_579589 [Gautieria morchelliformis]|nr:hypothetical protein JB92DRAFT_579589 [Gautieria morchelliformis]